MFDESRCSGCVFEGAPAQYCDECISCIKRQKKSHRITQKDVYSSVEEMLPVVDDKEIEEYL